MVAPQTIKTTAPIRNVALAMEAMDMVIHRPPHIPGVAIYSGHAGLGKSTAAAHIAPLYRAAYIEMKSYWSRKSFADHLASEVGVDPRKTMAQTVDAITNALLKSRRPVIVDQFHTWAEKGRVAIEFFRDLVDGSRAPWLLMGEE